MPATAPSGRARRAGTASPSSPAESDPVETRRGLPGDADDAHSSYLEAAVDGVLIAGLYLPNGNPAPGPKFDYKLRWFDRLIDHAARAGRARAPVVLAGDFNVMPTDLDVYKPERWLDDALFRPEVRDAFRRLVDQGWTDAIRTFIRTRRSTRSGTISGMPMPGMLDCASTTCCSTQPWQAVSSLLALTARCGVGTKRAITHQRGSSSPHRRRHPPRGSGVPGRSRD